jgi:signal transduction histidine kinase
MQKYALRWFKNSFVTKLMSAFLFVIVISALIIYLSTIQATQNAFRLYTTQNSHLWSERLSPEFAVFYSRAGSWQGVDAFIQTNLADFGSSGMMNGMGFGRGANRGKGQNAGSGGMGWMGGMGQRLILADAQGKVIADTENTLMGSSLTGAELASGSPVNVKGQLVGTLVVTPANIKSVGDPASTFLSSVNRSILFSVFVASLISLVLVLIFSIQITRPIRQMQKAATAISGGDLDQRVVVDSRDELGNLAETFNHMAENLARAQTQRQYFLADVAHELRTPLTVIQANTEGMQDGVLPLDLEQVNAIHAQTLLLGRLINDLRLLSLAEAGELRLECQETDLSELLQTVVDHFQPQCAQKNVALSVAIAQNLPQVWVDLDRIHQVLNNLLSNALRYTPEGGTISLDANWKGTERSSEVWISVSDTGPGIPAEALPWVFDRFYRADKSRSRASGGSGLGLAIVKQLVEAHHGRVWAESPVYPENDAAKGTRITFTIVPSPE